MDDADLAALGFATRYADTRRAVEHIFDAQAAIVAHDRAARYDMDALIQAMWSRFEEDLATAGHDTQTIVLMMRQDYEHRTAGEQ